MNLAYKAKNSDFWLKLRVEAMDTLGFVGVDGLAFPFADCLFFDAGEGVFKGALGSEWGKNTAAHRSNSRQSKKVFARRYLADSRASSRASVASLIV